MISRFIADPPRTIPGPPPLPSSGITLDRLRPPTIEDPHLDLTRIDVPATGDATPIRIEPETPQSVTRVNGGPDRGFPNGEAFYPPASIRLGETGTASVQVCVNAEGRLTAAPVLERSSGSRRLDEAALRLATAGSGHYRPSTEGGRAVSSCYSFPVEFRLRGS